MSVTMASAIARIGYRLFENSSQTISSTSQPSTTMVTQWINDTLSVFRHMCWEMQSPEGKSNELITTVVAAQISDISQASPCVITTNEAHGFANSDTVYLQGIAGMVELNHNTYNITVLSTTTFSLQDATTDADIDSSAYSDYEGYGVAVPDEYYSLTMYMPADVAIVYSDSSVKWQIHRCHERKKNEYDENMRGWPMEFYVKNQRVYVLPNAMDDVYQIELDYWARHTTLASDGTIPFDWPVDEWVVDSVVKIAQNQKEYEQLPIDQKMDFLASSTLQDYLVSLAGYEGYNASWRG